VPHRAGYVQKDGRGAASAQNEIGAKVSCSLCRQYYTCRHGVVFEDTRKHGEVKKGHREIQFAVALLCCCLVLKRESNSSELE